MRPESASRPSVARRWLVACALCSVVPLAACSTTSGGHSATPTAPTASATGASGGGSPATSSSGGGSPAAPAAPGTPAAGASALQKSYVSVVRKTLPSIVQIRTSKGLGSGVVFNDKGDIVTNAHVVGNATHFKVLPARGGKPLPATLVGKFAPDDIAVIKVSQGKLAPAKFADSSRVDVGDIVLAMGNPLGLSSSVTNGIVSAVGRTVSEPSEKGSPGATLPSVIQTSAAINPGNSGGALVNLSGQVVGIPTLAAVDPEMGGGSVAPGIGFAIPSNIATDIARQLADDGKVEDTHRAALGISALTVADAEGQPAGVGVAEVTSGGPADKAGIRRGDVIVAVAGQKTPSSQVLSTVLAKHKPGQKVAVTFVRGQKKRTVRLTLGELPDR